MRHSASRMAMPGVEFRATMSKHNLFMIMTAMLAKVNLTRVVNSTALAKADVTKGYTLQGIVTLGGYYARSQNADAK